MAFGMQGIAQSVMQRTGGAAMDLGLADQYRQQAKEEQDKLRKKRMQDQASQRMAPPRPGMGAFMSLSGNQY